MKSRVVDEPARNAEPAPSPCWHCQGTDSCDCIFCGSLTFGAVWISGPCGSCLGRRKHAQLQPRLEAANIDPREKRYWKRIGNKRDQQAPKLVFDPFNEIKE